MIIEKKILFFKSISIILDDEKAVDVAKKSRYSSIVILTYKKLNLPKFTFYTKPTLLIDIKRDENDILQGFNDTTRNEIRKTFNNDKLKIQIVDHPNEESFLLYKEFEYSQDRVPVSLDLLSQMMFFGAYLDGELISGIYVMKSFPYLRIRSIFSKRLKTEDRDIYRIIGYATRRLVWEVCLWGKKNNFVTLDMASVNIHNPETESIAKFKMSFGKNLTPEYVYTYKSTLFALFEKTVLIKNFFKKTYFSLKRLFS